MSITATPVSVSPFEHQLFTVPPVMRRSAHEGSTEAAEAVADMGHRIAALGRAVVLRDFGSCGSRAVAHAATQMARGGTITVIADMTMPGKVYSRLADAGHTGEVRMTTPQRLRRPGAQIPSHAVLVLDLDSLACSSRDNEAQMWQIMTAAARADRVLVAAHPHTRGLGSALEQLAALGGQFTIVDIT